MSGLPEVEHTARQLRATIVGATISEAQVFWERAIGYPALPAFLAGVAGRQVEGIRRRGKFLLLDLSGDLLMTIHRRMTGNLLILPPGWEVDTSLSQTDPLAWSTRGPSFRKVPAASKSTIKQALLTQEVIAGLGNIYADEALFYAAIHPLRRANSLSPTEVRLLHEGIVSVLTSAIEHGGTSFNDYRDLWGEAGENYDHVFVYHRAGQPCLRCGTPVERVTIAQRSAHFCPNCQKLTLE